MNDRFKFRAWDIEEQKYREVIALGQDHSFLLNIGHVRNDTQIFEQCTGLKDKNGKLIYEGDIVRDDIGLIAPVCFDEINAMFYIDRYIGVYNYPFAYFYHYDSETELEVIGNIHNNADLLENEE